MRILLIFFLLLQSSITAQVIHEDSPVPVQYRFAHIGVADGLSPGTVNCFFKDRTGFIWIATLSGLHRYDGYNLETFDPDPQDTLAQQSENYRRIFEDPLGNIWMQTPLTNYIFNPQTEQFSLDASGIAAQLNLAEMSIKNIVKDGAGNYWIIGEKGRLVKYLTATKEPIPISLSSAPEPAENVSISAFKENSAGDFWILYTNGVLEKMNGKTLKTVFRSTKLKAKFPDQLHDYEMIVDDQDNLWINLFENFGIFYYNVQQDSLRNFNEETSPLRLKSNFVNTIEKAADGKVWVATDHGGIQVINTQDFTVAYILNNVEIDNSLSHNSITALYKDGDGIMWVGTFKNGVDYYHPNIVRFPLYKNLLDDPESVPYNDVNVFAEDDKGNIYIGTNGGGLLYLDRKTGRYTQYLHQDENPESISSNIIVSLVYDHAGTLWIGTYRGGLNKMTSEGFIAYTHDTNDTTSIANDNVWELFEDSRNNLWVGTLTGGLDLMDREQGVFKHSKIAGGEYTLHDNYVAAIAEDDKGNIWVGGNTGIDVFNPVTRESTYYSHSAQDSTSLSSNYIFSIYPDHKGNVWVGTQDGLNLYNAKDNFFYHYNMEDGLPGKKIVALIADDQDDLWISSSYGITQFKKEETNGDNGRIPPNFKNYNDLDGLQGNLFNENAIFKTKKGEVLVGGMHGYNLFNPQRFQYNEQKPKIVITDFSLFNKPVQVGKKIDGRVLLQKPIEQTEEVHLKYSENLFSIEFAALDFFQPSKNKYSYKLEGFDNAWQDAGSSERRVTYTNLDPGMYQFKVRASNNDQLWNPEPTVLNIKVLPPFYRTIYAYLLYVAVIITVLYLARRRIIRRQRKNFKIEQDKREAHYLHEMDMMKIRFFTNISHEFKTPLSLILAPLEKLKNQEINQQGREQVENIDKNAQKLLRLINQVLDLGNIKKENLLTSSKGNIITFIEEIITSFEDLAKGRKVTLEFSSSVKAFYTAFDMDKLDKILFNLLSNAIKFTPQGGKVIFTIEIKKPSNPASNRKILEIKVQDSGIGIAKNEQEKIFQRFYKVEHPAKASHQGNGIGLSLVKEYVELYKGTIAVESTPGEGSSFILSLPLKDLGKTAPGFSQKQRSKEIKTTKKDLKIAEKRKFFTVVIIDDDEDFLNYLAKSLSESYRIFIARDGDAGWKKVLSVQPDLIVCDWAMPGMNGTDLCKKLRADNRTLHIPFIMLTANAQEKSKLQALKIGVNDYITKPFSLEALQSRIHNLITQRKLLQQAYSKKMKLPKIPAKIQLESEDEKLMRKVLELIRKNISNPDFSVKKLATELGVSRTFLYNKTMIFFEKPPLELITDLRLEQGKELLKNSQFTIAEIAFQVGFNNPKYFTRNFKKKYRMLPSKFKETLE